MTTFGDIQLAPIAKCKKDGLGHGKAYIVQEATSSIDQQQPLLIGREVRIYILTEAPSPRSPERTPRPRHKVEVDDQHGNAIAWCVSSIPI